MNDTTEENTQEVTGVPGVAPLSAVKARQKLGKDRRAQVHLLLQDRSLAAAEVAFVLGITLPAAHQLIYRTRKFYGMSPRAESTTDDVGYVPDALKDQIEGTS